MWAAVRQRFSAFHSALQLTETQLEDGRTKVLGIVGCLARAYYPHGTSGQPGMLVGSWGKGTQVRPPTDIDLMFELPPQNFARISGRVGNVQSALLQEVRERLLATYSTSEIRGDGQVVQVRFDTVMVEVVPVFRLQNNQFWMPDTNNGGSWRVVDPFSELSDLDTFDKACCGNARALIQMIKVWKKEHAVEIKNFLIEAIVQDFLRSSDHRAKSYFWFDWLVRDFFAYMLIKKNSAVNLTRTNQSYYLGNEWIPKAEKAYSAAVAACGLEYCDRHIEAGIEWQKIFGVRIPSVVI